MPEPVYDPTFEPGAVTSAETFDGRLAKLNALEPRDLDLAVALKQGWTWRQPPGVPMPMLYPPNDASQGMGQIVPLYSTEWDAARPLLEELIERFTALRLEMEHVLEAVGASPSVINYTLCIDMVGTDYEIAESSLARAVATTWLLNAEELIVT